MNLKIRPTDQNQLNILIGGHYNFPSLPSEFAMNSLEYVARLQEENPNQCVLLSFVNDIRFSNFCSIGACELDLSTNAQLITIEHVDLEKITMTQIASYDRQFTFTLSDTIVGKVVSIIQTGYLKKLSNFILDTVQLNAKIVKNNKGIKLSALYYIVHASKQYLLKGYKNDLIFAMDYFLYCYDKDNFIPFFFKQNFRQLSLIWEKSIYNYASKTIRKFHEKNLSQNLSVAKESDTNLYTCKAFDGSTIELRKEETVPYFNAVNKCPLVIATLYYKIISSYYKSASNLNIYYIIPSYDRSRVNLGTEAFFNVYFDELSKNISNLNVNIHNVYWIESQPSVQIVDTYSKNSKSITIYE